jgi:hypothetical protein
MMSFSEQNEKVRRNGPDCFASMAFDQTIAALNRKELSPSVQKVTIRKNLPLIPENKREIGSRHHRRHRRTEMAIMPVISTSVSLLPALPDGKPN